VVQEESRQRAQWQAERQAAEDAQAAQLKREAQSAAWLALWSRRVVISLGLCFTLVLFWWLLEPASRLKDMRAACDAGLNHQGFPRGLGAVGCAEPLLLLLVLVLLGGGAAAQRWLERATEQRRHAEIQRWKAAQETRKRD
jgi:hypothetical protein